eukprot:3495818-Prymnesium_polylepis.1
MDHSPPELRSRQFTGLIEHDAELRRPARRRPSEPEALEPAIERTTEHTTPPAATPEHTTTPPVRSVRLQRPRPWVGQAGEVAAPAKSTTATAPRATPRSATTIEKPASTSERDQSIARARTTLTQPGRTFPPLSDSAPSTANTCGMGSDSTPWLGRGSQ